MPTWLLDYLQGFKSSKSDNYDAWCKRQKQIWPMQFTSLPCPVKLRPTYGDYHDLIPPRISIDC